MDPGTRPHSSHRLGVLLPEPLVWLGLYLCQPAGHSSGAARMAVVLHCGRNHSAGYNVRETSQQKDILLKTTPFRALISYIRVLVFVKRQERKNVNIGDIFEANVARQPDKLAIVSESQQWTFRQVNEHANRVANVFHSHGYKKGDVVGLLMENRAEFVATWLGLSKIGVITPLINTNLRGASLQHSITVGQCTALIYGANFRSAVMDIAKDLPAHVGLYQFNDEATQDMVASEGLSQGLAQQLNGLLDTAAKDKVAAGASRADHQDKLVYIYTSGTTGLPKAAVITHAR